MLPLQDKLRVLDIGNNMIEKIENISHLKNLEEFWVSIAQAACWPFIELILSS
jgi:protein phosphatase 1 regulatory subunit 7